MLRKLFPTSNNSNAPTDKPVRVVEKDEWDERTGFAHAVTTLDQFEARLGELLRTLTRHCQAIAELCASTMAFNDQLSGLFFDTNGQMPTRPAAGDDAVGLVNMFRVSAIAPLQSVLIMVPQLRMRCEHRKSAMQLMIRYQHKVNDLERTSKSKAESSKLQRNRAKLQAATSRFRDLDAHVQQEIRALVSKDITSMVASAVSELLIRAQLLAGNMAVESASRFQPLVAPPLQENDQEKSTSFKDKDGKTTDKDRPDQTTPQRRMAMIVVAETNDVMSHGAYVRQSILAPPLPPPVLANAALSTTNVTNRSHRPSTSVTEADDEEEEDETTEEEQQEQSRVVLQADVHEDYGIGKRKKHIHGTRTWDIHQHIKENLSTEIDPVDCVRLPDGFARDEWIAVHVVDFFNEINLLYGTISEFCTPETCPRMSAGPAYSYTWVSCVGSQQQQQQQQQVSASSPANLPASAYVAKLMDWIEFQINDPAIFPSNSATYATDFESQTASVILKRLFRVYAHMYHSHLEHFAELSAETHLAFCFKRFIFFIKEFDLVEKKELNALRKLIQSIQENPDQ